MSIKIHERSNILNEQQIKVDDESEILEWVKEKLNGTEIPVDDIQFINEKLKFDEKENKIALGGILELLKVIAFISIFVSFYAFVATMNIVIRLGVIKAIFPQFLASIINIVIGSTILFSLIGRKKKMKKVLIAISISVFLVNITFALLGFVEPSTSMILPLFTGLYYFTSKRVKYTFLN